MKYKYYRCMTENCGAIVTVEQIEKEGKCKVCGGRKMRVANWRGFNMPKPREFILIFLGLR